MDRFWSKGQGKVDDWIELYHESVLIRLYLAATNLCYSRMPHWIIRQREPVRSRDTWPPVCPSRSACPKKVPKLNLTLKYIHILLKIVEKGNCNCNSLRHLRVTEFGHYFWICNNSSESCFLEVIVICCKNYQIIRAKNYPYQFFKKLGSLDSTRFILKKIIYKLNEKVVDYPVSLYYAARQRADKIRM